ncbi:MAG: NAD-dependent succinate-semialdehyde dehydrogenase [Pseudomonadota bacterium]
MPLVVVNPATDQVVRELDTLTPTQVTRAIELAGQAFERWRRTDFDQRASVLRTAAGLLRQRSEDLARLMATEMGKAVRDGRAEVEKCAWVCEFYADNARDFLAREPVDIGGETAFVSYQPLGPVLAVMPWNFPLWQVFRFAAPALMAGNVGLLKHASNVPGCALAIEDVLRDAGLPAHCFTSLLIGSAEVEAVIEHPAVRAVTLTGSTPAGRAVAAAAGRALKKSVLELGGSDPYLILEDANIDEAASICAASRLTNAGQSCIAAKRFIVVEAVRPAFEKALVDRLAAAVMGDPLDDKTMFGPQARRDLRDELHGQVLRSIEMGARKLLGCEVPPGPGAFYPASALGDVRKGMPAFDEELFGPVAAIVPAADEAEAIALANDSVYGLGAAVFTHDRVRGERIAERQLDAGCCFVNGLVRSDPRLPFGGIKESGYGRELGRHGIREFVNTKTVVVA